MLTIGMFPIFVSDQQRALEFYRDKLGFTVVMNNPYTGYGPEGFRWITVAPDPKGPQIILYHPGMQPENEQALRARVGIWTGLIFHTDDIHGTHETWSKRGVAFEAPPSKQMWGGWETWFSDPDGNRFHLGTPE
jgi:catechol 2,3-dioxygenase-like lactoylglutathione lyase family enzyme